MAFDKDTNTLERNPQAGTASDTKFASDPEKDLIERDETRELISSEKVDGTAVYSRDGEKLGSIHHFMVGKRSGRVSYAVMSFGGLFGMGEDYYPLPWDSLTYDTSRKGYVVDITKDMLDKDKQPSYARDSEPEWNDDFDTRIRTFYIRTA